MTEEILKIKAQELAIIRLISTGEDAQTVEIALGNAKAWAFRCGNRQMAAALNGLIDGLAYFSRKDVEPSLEFVIPIKR
jgi:hypothetical protein